MSVLNKNAKNFLKVTDHISEKSVFQKKAVRRLIENADSQYIDFAEDFVTRLNRAIGGGEQYEYMATSYLNYTKSIRLEEMYFAKEKKYRFSDFSEVYKLVYGRDDYMFDYVVGLGMTQIFWPNHYEIVRFYLDSFIPKVIDCENGVEIGVGHGLFHSELLRLCPKIKTRMLDISQTSLNMTMKMIAATGIEPKRTTPMLCDIQKEIPIGNKTLEVLLMGELIEHLQDGEAVLSKMAQKMKPGGYCFFTTAANAPAEDHIMLFRNTTEIRDLLERSGWGIVEEHIGTLRGMSIEEAENGGHNINYASVLTIT